MTNPCDHFCCEMRAFRAGSVKGTHSQRFWRCVMRKTPLATGVLNETTNPTQQLMGARTILRWLSAKPNGKGGFTRIELLAVMVAVTLLAALALPVLAASTANSQSAQCLNNLRQMGRAVQMWGSEHVDEPPWQTFVSQGGLRTTTGSRPGNAWFEYSYLSNELATPRVLACPSDSGVIVAPDFSAYRSSSFRANANSYFINLHTTSAYPSGLLFGDRNVRAVPGFGCYLQINNIHGLEPSDPNSLWTNAVHSVQGNIVRMDGSIEVASDGSLRDALMRADDDLLGAEHILRPR
jgi:type II secretory pathway pseudopilin PulG